MSWTSVDAAYALAAMPARYKAQYDAWIADHPEFEARFEEIVAQQVARARQAIASRPANTLDPTEDSLPDGTLLPIVDLITYHMMFEMGDETLIDLDIDLRSSMTRADMHVTQLRYTNITCDEAAARPSYTPPETPRGTLT